MLAASYSWESMQAIACAFGVAMVAYLCVFALALHAAALAEGVRELEHGIAWASRWLGRRLGDFLHELWRLHNND